MRFYEGECPQCELPQACPNPDDGLEAVVWCPRCQRRWHIKCKARMGVRRLPTPQELLAVAEKYEHSCPVLAKVAVNQMQRGAFEEVPTTAPEPEPVATVDGGGIPF